MLEGVLESGFSTFFITLRSFFSLLEPSPFKENKWKKSPFRSFAPFSKLLPWGLCLTNIWVCCSLLSLCLLLWISFLTPRFPCSQAGFLLKNPIAITQLMYFILKTVFVLKFLRIELIYPCALDNAMGASDYGKQTTSIPSTWVWEMQCEIFHRLSCSISSCFQLPQVDWKCSCELHGCSTNVSCWEVRSNEQYSVCLQAKGLNGSHSSKAWLDQMDVITLPASA